MKSLLNDVECEHSIGRSDYHYISHLGDHIDYLESAASQ